VHQPHTEPEGPRAAAHEPCSAFSRSDSATCLDRRVGVLMPSDLVGHAL
jgi:hypothetical protein